MFMDKDEVFGHQQQTGEKYGVHDATVRNYYRKKCNSMNYSPKCLWCSDREKEKQGLHGSYFLKFFSKLPTTPLYSTSNNSKNLTFYYEGPYQTSINFEIKADFNVILKAHTSAVFTEVYIDATNVEKTDVTVKVTNNALITSVFFVFLTDCPLHLPAGFSHISTSSAVIAPQHQHVFHLTVLFQLPKNKFFCSIDVKNFRHEVVAFRRIRFQKNDRCICIWHCCCTCLEADEGLKCHPLPIDHYNAAGFYGGLPMASRYVVSTSFVEEYLVLMLHVCFTMVLLLLLMGVCKAVIGLCYPSVGGFGLDWYIDLPESIKRYYESNLRLEPVQYDDLVHSDKRRRSRSISLGVEFMINVIFFLCYPCILLHAVVVRICSSKLDDDINKGSCTCCNLIGYPMNDLGSSRRKFKSRNS